MGIPGTHFCQKDNIRDNVTIDFHTVYTHGKHATDRAFAMCSGSVESDCISVIYGDHLHRSQLPVRNDSPAGVPVFSKQHRTDIRRINIHIRTL
jgi:hypothetical protein